MMFKAPGQIVRSSISRPSRLFKLVSRYRNDDFGVSDVFYNFYVVFEDSLSRADVIEDVVVAVLDE